MKQNPANLITSGFRFAEVVVGAFGIKGYSRFWRVLQRVSVIRSTQRQPKAASVRNDIHSTLFELCQAQIIGSLGNLHIGRVPFGFSGKNFFQ